MTVLRGSRERKGAGRVSGFEWTMPERIPRHNKNKLSNSLVRRLWQHIPWVGVGSGFMLILVALVIISASSRRYSAHRPDPLESTLIAESKQSNFVAEAQSSTSGNIDAASLDSRGSTLHDSYGDQPHTNDGRDTAGDGYSQRVGGRVRVRGEGDLAGSGYSTATHAAEYHSEKEVNSDSAASESLLRNREQEATGAGRDDKEIYRETEDISNLSQSHHSFTESETNHSSMEGKGGVTLSVHSQPFEELRAGHLTHYATEAEPTTPPVKEATHESRTGAEERSEKSVDDEEEEEGQGMQDSSLALRNGLGGDRLRGSVAGSGPNSTESTDRTPAAVIEAGDEAWQQRKGTSEGEVESEPGTRAETDAVHVREAAGDSERQPADGSSWSVRRVGDEGISLHQEAAWQGGSEGSMQEKENVHSEQGSLLSAEIASDAGSGVPRHEVAMADEEGTEHSDSSTTPLDSASRTGTSVEASSEDEVDPASRVEKSSPADRGHGSAGVYAEEQQRTELEAVEEHGRVGLVAESAVDSHSVEGHDEMESLDDIWKKLVDPNAAATSVTAADILKGIANSSKSLDELWENHFAKEEGDSSKRVDLDALWQKHFASEQVEGVGGTLPRDEALGEKASDDGSVPLQHELGTMDEVHTSKQRRAARHSLRRARRRQESDSVDRDAAFHVAQPSIVASNYDIP